jgi:hypothetical protein
MTIHLCPLVTNNPLDFWQLCLPLSTPVCHNPSRSVGRDGGLVWLGFRNEECRRLGRVGMVMAMVSISSWVRLDVRNGSSAIRSQVSEKIRVLVPIPWSDLRMLEIELSRRGSSSPGGSTDRSGQSREESSEASSVLPGDRQARYRGRAEQVGKCKGPLPVGAPPRPGLFRPTT